MRSSPPGVVGSTEDNLRVSAVPYCGFCGVTTALRKECVRTQPSRSLQLSFFVALPAAGVNGKKGDRGVFCDSLRFIHGAVDAKTVSGRPVTFASSAAGMKYGSSGGSGHDFMVQHSAHQARQGRGAVRLLQVMLRRSDAGHAVVFLRIAAGEQDGEMCEKPDHPFSA